MTPTLEEKILAGLDPHDPDHCSQCDKGEPCDVLGNNSAIHFAVQKAREHTATLENIVRGQHKGNQSLQIKVDKQRVEAATLNRHVKKWKDKYRALRAVKELELGVSYGAIPRDVTFQEYAQGYFLAHELTHE